MNLKYLSLITLSNLSKDLKNSVFGTFHRKTFHRLTFHRLTFHRLTFHRLIFHRLTFHRLTIHRLTFHRLAFHRLTFHRLAFHRLTFHRLTFHRLPFHRLKFHRKQKLRQDISQIGLFIDTTCHRQSIFVMDKEEYSQKSNFKFHRQKSIFFEDNLRFWSIKSVSKFQKM